MSIFDCHNCQNLYGNNGHWGCFKGWNLPEGLDKKDCKDYLPVVLSFNSFKGYRPSGIPDREKV